MSRLEDMVVQAADTRERAHAPYSGFKVGACLKTADGRLFAGCNVENVAYPQSQCAEATAIGIMVAAGQKTIVEVVIVAESDRLCTPCGGCRQRLAEFAAPDTPVHICSPQGLIESFTLGDLLPAAFTFEPPAPGSQG
ncbi:MAG TPA: cytidine deaminase [Kiloniellaceae bacterium]|nr:cytidine deaminase [Kiloniellaceae bacterium]